MRVSGVESGLLLMLYKMSTSSSGCMYLSNMKMNSIPVTKCILLSSLYTKEPKNTTLTTSNLS